MPPLVRKKNEGQEFWRSLEDRAGTEEFRRFVEREFPATADEMLAPASRRNFLKLMGASMALAGMTACRWPSEEILPYTRRPEDRLPGVPLHFATAVETAGVALGVLVKSYDGRPVKVEGNPAHPASLGATDAIAQATLLELYDPDRSRHPVRNDGATRNVSDWPAFESWASEQFAVLRRNGGRGFRVLAEASASPSIAALRRRLARELPAARWYEYEAVSRDNQRQGSVLAFGKPHRTHLSLDAAESIISFDEDFLLHHPAAVRQAREFVAGRSPERDHANRLYVFESSYSTTGSMADHRIPLPSKMIPVAVGCLAAELFLEQGLALPGASAELRRIFERYQYHPFYTELDWSFARELIAQRGKSLVLAGPRQPAEVHALVHLINHALGNVGATVHYTVDPDEARPVHAAAIRELADEVESGAVETLLILGGNPALNAPADVDVAALLGGAGETIHLSLHEDETSELCDWHLPRAHPLESWGDARDDRGTISIVQPLIRPLYGGRTAIELLALLLGQASPSGYEIVRETFAGAAGDVTDGSEDAWRRSLHDGLVEGSAWPTVAPRPAAAGWVNLLKPHLRSRPEMPEGQLELTFLPDMVGCDGRFANNGWLQELPDSLTKITWGNAALIAPATAASFDLGQGDVVRIERGDAAVELPVFLMPGQAPGTIAARLGYGRRRCGNVGEGVGVDLYPLRPSGALDRVGVSISKAKGKADLPTTQDHFAIDALGMQERAERSVTLVREADFEEFKHDPEHALHGPHIIDAKLWETPEPEGHQWGMAVDLNTCTGCSACVVACQAENNIPVVGADEVARGREMHWLRVDRYFSGEPERPTVRHQPVMCQHCETAPCEQVCPVAATVHDTEGLNVMVYNRCIGTRYCANNCPYKVRRFNYFDNRKDDTPIETMIYNPEVTVRSRGVMEKCTYCLQRINAVKIRAKNERRPIADGEVTTACAQACPTQAITFGDLSDPDSRVRALHDDARSYGMLEEMNIRPRTRYLGRLRNRRPEGDPDSEKA